MAISEGRKISHVHGMVGYCYTVIGFKERKESVNECMNEWTKQKRKEGKGIKERKERKKRRKENQNGYTNQK